MKIVILPFLLTVSLGLVAMDVSYFKGVTVSCQGYGRVWGSDEFARELDRLKSLGANSVTIHPYARIHEDGRVSWRDWESGNPPQYIVRPIREAHQRGMKIMIKPHLAYWGSPFSWRGDIKFSDPEAKSLFYDSYARWIIALAELTSDTDLFVVGTELKQMTGDEAQWRSIIQAVRRVTKARLTYAANWDHFESVPFWDHLDLIGVQGYFPISKKPNPAISDLEEGWQPVLNKLKAFHSRVGRPVIFTEFGYNRALNTAAEPWSYQQDTHPEAEQLQARCLNVGLTLLGREHAWFHGAFLWKWFVGPASYSNFYLDTPTMRDVISQAWR